MARLADKIAFITGAGAGIGRATAILFAREGAKVAIAEIDAPAGEETAHLAGNEAIAIRTDVTDPDSLQSAIRATQNTAAEPDDVHQGRSRRRRMAQASAPLCVGLMSVGTVLVFSGSMPRLVKLG